jgi:hypothetical protein
VHDLLKVSYGGDPFRTSQSRLHLVEELQPI